MTSSEKLEMLKVLLGATDDDSADDRLAVYLDAASREILAWRFPSNSEQTEVPAEYEMTQIHAVIAGYSISGAENQTKHTENGISRDFKYEDMLAYIHAHVIPFVRTVHD